MAQTTMDSFLMSARHASTPLVSDQAGAASGHASVTMVESRTKKSASSVGSDGDGLDFLITTFSDDDENLQFLIGREFYESHFPEITYKRRVLTMGANHSPLRSSRNGHLCVDLNP